MREKKEQQDKVVHLIDDYYVSIDRLCMALYKETANKSTGKMRRQTFGYFRKIGGVINELARQMRYDALPNQSDDLKSAVQLLIDTNTRILREAERIEKEIEVITNGK